MTGRHANPIGDDVNVRHASLVEADRVARMRDAPIDAYLRELHQRHAATSDGSLATYIPELAKADPAWLGISLVTADGAVYEVGDTRQAVSIQSISKPFSFAFALDELGKAEVHGRVGVEPSGDPFNSIELGTDTGMPHNPMVNSGAITTTGLVFEQHGDETAARLLDSYGEFAGRRLTLDEAVYRSELATAHRNRAIAHLLRGCGALRGDPERVLEAYLRQCSTLVDTRDLASMAATLANAGVNPLTGRRAASAETVSGVLTVMATCGMYDSAGEWLYTVGLPAKSGVSGGVIAVLPGRLGIAVLSPLIDTHGNSVRGVAVCRQLAADLDLHLARVGGDDPSPIRSLFTLADIGSRRWRPPADVELIARRGAEVIALALQGQLDFAAAELVVRRTLDAEPEPRFAVLDLRRVTVVHEAGARFVSRLDVMLSQRGGRLVVCGAPLAMRPVGPALPTFDDLDLALEWCENQLLDAPTTVVPWVPLGDHEVVIGLDDHQLARLESQLESRSIRAGAFLTRLGEPLEGLVLVVSGNLSVLVPAGGRPPRRLATINSGMLSGELAVSGDRESVVDVVANTDVEYLLLPTSALDALRTTEPEIWATLLTNVVTSVANRVDRLNAELAVLAR